MPVRDNLLVIRVACSVVAGVFILWRGLQPVLGGPETDFPNYYTAASLVVGGADVSRSYDDDWFQSQMHRLGFQQDGKFSPFPPPTALVLIPLSWMDPLSAFRTFTVLNLFALVFCVLLVRDIAAIRWDAAMLLVLAAGTAIANTLRFGQLYIVVALLMLLAFRLAQEGRHLLAGAAAGAMLPVKYFPVILLFWFLWKKQWKAATATIVTAAAVTVVSLIVMGPEVFRTFITSVLPDHLRSRYSHQSPYAVAFQSWDSLLMRLFVWNAEENPAPLADAPGVYLIVKWLILLAGAACTGWLAVRAGQTSSPGAAEGLLAFLGIGSLLLAPGTATYHFVLLWLPLALLLKLHGGSAALRRIAVFSYVAIGWIPYSWFRVAEQAGGAMMVFAYPRLLLLTILFIATLRLVGRSPSPVVPQGALA